MANKADEKSANMARKLIIAFCVIEAVCIVILFAILLMPKELFTSHVQIVIK